MKERIEKEIQKYRELNEKMLRATIPCFTEVDYNRGYIDGLRYALELIEKHEADERLHSRKGMTHEERIRKRKLEKHVEMLKEMRNAVLKDENWENMKRVIEALTAGAMAIQRIIEEDFGESEDAYADFDRYKEDILHAEPDELPDDN